MSELERTGAEILADTVGRWPLTHAFHVPGEGILEILDAMSERQPQIRLVHCRHEGGMAFMAGAAGRLSGRPGLCFAARAPGALNTCLALHTAQTDSAPMIMVVGQASSQSFEREAFLDVAFHTMFGPVAKWVALIDDPARIPEYFSRAYHIATSGRMGPVVLVVPEDILQARANAVDLPVPMLSESAATPGALRLLTERLTAAKRPLLVLGGSGWSDASCRHIQQFAEHNRLPVIVSYRRRDLFDNAHPCFIGELGIGLDPAVTRRVQEADLLLVIGTRLGELNTIGAGFHGYSLLAAPKPAQVLVHIHAELAELNQVYQADLAINASPDAAAAALTGLKPLARGAWDTWLRDARDSHDRYLCSGECPGPIDLKHVFTWLRQRLPLDSVIAVGAGAYALWPQRYFTYHKLGTQLGPKSGAMGYGLPAAIAAALMHPDRLVVAVAGDGCFMMHAEELATAVHHNVPVIVVVINNHAYGAIRLGQQRLFGRTVGVDLTNPNFADFAASFGAYGERVEATEQFAPAFERAIAARKPAVIELITPPEATRPASQPVATAQLR